MRRVAYLIFSVFLTASSLFSGTTGKIAGVVTDAETGEPLPGVNVYLEGTTRGAATDLDGFYVIVNVEPGTYTMQVVNVGYASKTFTDVRVFIDQTTEINVQLGTEAIELDEAISVVAERPVVEKDVAASRANISTEEVEALPLANVSEVVALQAGAEGLEIRGGGLDEVVFIMDGFNLRDGRDNEPYTGISLTSIKEIQLQAGGFSAEYGDFRSGLINVVTKEGSKSDYNVNAVFRYSPIAAKHFGPAFNDFDAYYVRPFLDDEVAWVGTDNGGWDEWTRLQYPDFVGWNEIARRTLEDDDPSNDLTPRAAQELFLFQHRKQTDIDKPDYDVDIGFGGPVPFLTKDLGNLRFFTAYRRLREMYLVPLSREAYTTQNWQINFTSDLGPGKKLVVSGLIGEEVGTSRSRAGAPSLFTAPWQIASDLTTISFVDSRIFSTDYWNPSRVNFNNVGIKFTNAISSKTFYEAKIQRFESRYSTSLGALRDTTRRYQFGNSFFVDEAPFGFWEAPSSGVDGMRMSVGFSNARDSSVVVRYHGKFDISSQVNRYNNVKAGAEFVITDSRVNYARFDKFLPSGNAQTKWNRTPVQGAIYVEDKLEFEGMIASVGLRMDYTHAGGEWYSGYNPYDAAFSGDDPAALDTLNQEPTEHIFTFSPRLAVSFPVSENSKIYFNYGHFRQVPQPENFFILRQNGQTNAVERIADPNNPLPKTIAYELGYEHSLFDEYLIRTAGFYKDISDQPNIVTYISSNTRVNINEPNSYEDIRGFELTINKNRGRWVRGFINYTYQVESSGTFGFRNSFENSVQQREEERRQTNYEQSKPRPRPYARANLSFFTPNQYGPSVAGVYLLDNVTFSLLANWRSGGYFNWTNGAGAAELGIDNNVQWTDYYNVNMRFRKGLEVGPARVDFFMDVQNLFNFKLFSTYGFVNEKDDFNRYMRSLHLSENTEGLDQLGYINIPGEDQPGDYRKSGVPFIPIVTMTNRNSINNPNTNDLYYEASSGQYLSYNEQGEWTKAKDSRVNYVLDNKAYIDMPNQSYLTFLNPRDIFWGIEISFDF